MFREEDVIYAYTRENAIEDGIIIEVTSYYNGFVSRKVFDKVFMTTTLFEDILKTLTPDEAYHVMNDISEIASKIEYREAINHKLIPKEKIFIKNTEEDNKRILECCYVSED